MLRFLWAPWVGDSQKLEQRGPSGGEHQEVCGWTSPQGSSLDRRWDRHKVVRALVVGIWTSSLKPAFPASTAASGEGDTPRWEPASPRASVPRHKGRNCCICLTSFESRLPFLPSVFCKPTQARGEERPHLSPS